MMDRDVVIVSAVRTPFGRFGGPMKDIPLEELGALVMKEVMRRPGLPTDAVEESTWATPWLLRPIPRP